MNQNSIRVGKDVLESLTTSMYEDHRSIYREYIQNSCDQIDKAVKEGILDNIDSGEIHINIDKDQRVIEIYDNATGIKEKEVYPILGNIALSNKDRDNERGFRGIGRLAGLGYCEELIFETSYIGEEIKSTMSWNAKKFKEIINNRENREEATKVIESIITSKQEIEEIDKHYFRVVLKGVTNDELLNIKGIKEYLSMVAPLPMKNSFIYKNMINEELKKDNLSIDEYAIYINEEQIYKAYVSDIKNNKKKRIDKIYNVKFIKIYDEDNQLICWGWYGISNFKGVMHPINIHRGIRLRKGNIQIGLEDALNKLHRENRGNNYFIGEIHAFHKELIPNARRDYFAENQMYKIFERELKEIFHNILHKLYYKASAIRSETRKIESYNQIQEEFEKKEKEGFFNSKDELEQYQKEIEEKRVLAIKAKEKIDKMKKAGDEDIKKIISRISRAKPKERVNPKRIPQKKPKYRTQTEYPKLNKRTQKIISEIYNVIDEVLSPDLSEELKNKIRERLN
jgi:molecular chaperone HtpG